VSDFIKIFNLNIDENSIISESIIYNDKKKIILKENLNILERINFFIKYGVSLYLTKKLIQKTIENFKKIYSFQEKDNIFENINEFLTIINAKDIINIPFFQLIKDNFISKNTLNNLLVPIIKVNYLQNEK
jgi:hypothetical protein